MSPLADPVVCDALAVLWISVAVIWTAIWLIVDPLKSKDGE